MKTYAHECLACNGEGTVEIDHARTRSYSGQPVEDDRVRVLSR